MSLYCQVWYNSFHTVARRSSKKNDINLFDSVKVLKRGEGDLVAWLKYLSRQVSNTMASQISLLWRWLRSRERKPTHEIAPLLEARDSSDLIVEDSLTIMAGKSDPPAKYDTFVSSPTESDDEHTAFAQRKNPFQDAEVAEHWRLTYEKSQYECRHVFDPSLTWSEEEEKRLIRKLDWRICLWAVCSLLLLVSV
jgi:hypothetical protein